MIRCEEQECGRQDPYYSSCHLFSLALGMFAMATTHSRPIDGDLAILRISWCTHDEDDLVREGKGAP